MKRWRLRQIETIDAGKQQRAGTVARRHKRTEILRVDKLVSPRGQEFFDSSFDRKGRRLG
jgi:hypothetical protein